MREFTFIMTVAADTDVYIGKMGVYIPPGQAQTAELADVYESINTGFEPATGEYGRI